MKFHLREILITDLDNLVKYANEKDVSSNMTDRFPHPYTVEDGKKFIEFARSQKPVHIKAIIIDDNFSGAIGIHPQDDIFRKNAEMGYWLAAPFRDHGIMPKAIKQMVDYGFNNFDITRIFARPFGRNVASQRVLEKSGFTLEAQLKNTIYKNEKYEDEWIYAMRREDWLKG